MSVQSSSLPPKASGGSLKGSNANPIPSGPSVTQQFFTNDLNTRRSTSSTSIARHPNPRGTQDNRVKNKGGKKFKPLAVDDDVDAERFSMQNPHGRRGQQSITHLMSFALPPRPSNSQSYQRSSYRRDGRVNQTWGLGSGHHATDKARYIHANYRFIVDPRGNYLAQACDSDAHLDWENVLQVIASAKSQTASCPICLGHPTAPRMAKCGHIFCLPCLIRYMNSDEGSQSPNERRARWKKCPICWDSVYVSETRPLRWYTGQERDIPCEGEDVVLRLLTRQQGRTLAIPRESDDIVAAGDDIPWYFATDAMDYCRVVKGSESYMLEQYDQAIDEVKCLEQEDELMFGEDPEWTGRAVRLLHEFKTKTMGMGNPPAFHLKPRPSTKTEYRSRSLDGRGETNGQTSSSIGADDQTLNVEPYVPRTLTEMRDRQAEKPQPSEYVFYHALQHYYLAPLDIRILKTAFGSYQAFPSSILTRVERVSAGHIVDDEFRKRVKYLAHLPYGCEVTFLECDWTDTVPAEILNEFSTLLQKRRRRHDEKAAREEKERIRIEKVGEKELAEIRRKRPLANEDWSSTGTFNAQGQEFASSLPTPSQAGTISMSSPPNGRSTTGFSSLATPSTSPSMSRTVWGTTMVAPTSPDIAFASHQDGSSLDDGWLQGWETDVLDRQEDQLLENINQLNLSEASYSSSSGAKKGKKGKKITLMSTTARRGA